MNERKEGERTKGEEETSGGVTHRGAAEVSIIMVVVQVVGSSEYI